MTSGTNDSGAIAQVSGAETAVLAGGCFWGMQDLIRRQPGILGTRVGYTGGQNEHPTYRDHPGHAEAIEVVAEKLKSEQTDPADVALAIEQRAGANEVDSVAGRQRQLLVVKVEQR